MEETMIRMYRDSLDELPHPVLPEGYAVRRIAPGEEAAWSQLLHENGQLGEWDEKRTLDAFRGEKGRVWKESIHFVDYQGESVATACVQLHDDHPDLPEMGWVSVSSDHRGKRLGQAISLVILHFIREQGFKHCFLQTHTHRLPAIRIYLDMGFRPYVEDKEYNTQDWDEVMETIGKRKHS